METVRCGCACDLEAAREIWAECFGEDRFCDWFFARLYDPNCLRVLEIEGQVVSMAFCFPRELALPGEELCAWYLYAIGTRKHARCHGYAKRLIAACLEEAWKNGAALCFLIPAEERLFSYYRACGFDTVWTRKELRGKHSVSCSDLTLQPVCGEFLQINQLYEYVFPARVKRSPMDWQLISEDFRMGGGELCLLMRGEKMIGYCCMLKTEQVLQIRELGLLPGECTEAVCNALCFLSNAETWRYTAPGTGLPFAAVCSKRNLDGFEVNCDLMYN